MVHLSHPCMTTGKTVALTIWTFVSKVMSLLFNTLSRFVIAILPRSRRLLISWLQASSTVILEPEKIVCHCFHFFTSTCCEVMGPDAMILTFWMLSCKPAFSLSSFILIKKLFISLSAIRVVSSEVIGISPSSLDSCSCFFQPGVSHDVFCIEIK